MAEELAKFAGAFAAAKAEQIVKRQATRVGKAILTRSFRGIKRVAASSSRSRKRRAIETLAEEAERIDPMARRRPNRFGRSSFRGGRRTFKRIFRRGRRRGIMRRAKRMGMTLPKNAMIKFRTCLRTTIGDATPFAQIHFNANSVNDPFGATSGIQPFGHDQWGNFYSGYTVRACKLKVTFKNLSPVDCYVGIVFNDDAVWDPATNGVQATKCGYNIRKVYLRALNAGAATSQIRTVTLYRTIRGILQRGDPHDEAMSAAIGSNPSALCFCHVFAMEESGAINIGTNLIVCQVEMIQYTVLKNRVDLAAS